MTNHTTLDMFCDLNILVSDFSNLYEAKMWSNKILFCFSSLRQRNIISYVLVISDSISPQWFSLLVVCYFGRKWRHDIAGKRYETKMEFSQQNPLKPQNYFHKFQVSIGKQKLLKKQGTSIISILWSITYQYFMFNSLSFCEE